MPVVVSVVAHGDKAVGWPKSGTLSAPQAPKSKSGILVTILPFWSHAEIPAKPVVSPGADHCDDAETAASVIVKAVPPLFPSQSCTEVASAGVSKLKIAVPWLVGAK